MTRTFVAVMLIVLGLAGLLYGGFTYTRQKNVVDLGPVHVTQQKHERVPISPIVGGLVLISGVWLLVSSRHA